MDAKVLELIELGKAQELEDALKAYQQAEAELLEWKEKWEAFKSAIAKVLPTWMTPYIDLNLDDKTIDNKAPSSCLDDIFDCQVLINIPELAPMIIEIHRHEVDGLLPRGIKVAWAYTESEDCYFRFKHSPLSYPWQDLNKALLQAKREFDSLSEHKIAREAFQKKTQEGSKPCYQDPLAIQLERLIRSIVRNEIEASEPAD